MQAPDGELIQLRWDYHVMGAEFNDTAHVIKQKYHALVKEWHPDKWAQEPDKFVQATRKLQDINASYDRIRHAPLRYHISSHPRLQEKQEQRARYRDRPYRQTTSYETAELARIRAGIRERAQKRARTEAVLRFIFGFIGGLVIAVLIEMYWGARYPLMARPAVFNLLYVVVPLLCAWGNARYKDGFWSRAGESFFEIWWWFR